jgi:hypothetical protein
MQIKSAGSLYSYIACAFRHSSVKLELHLNGGYADVWLGCIHANASLKLFIFIPSFSFFLHLFSSFLHFFYYFYFLRRRKEREEPFSSSYKFPTLPFASPSYFRLFAVHIYIFPIYFFVSVAFIIFLFLFPCLFSLIPYIFSSVFNITFPACTFISARKATVSLVTSVSQSVLPRASGDSHRTEFQDISCLYF